MNSASTLYPTAALALAASLFAFTPTASLAREEASPASAPLVAAIQDASAEKPFDFEFRGGSVSEFFTALKDASGEAVNIVIPESGRDVAIPPMSLRGVNNAAVISVLNAIGQSDPRPFQIEGIADNIWIFDIAPRPSDAPQQETAFLPVSRQLKTQTIEDILTAITTAWRLRGLPGSPESHIVYHEDTKLIIASGTPEMLAIVRSILDALATEVSSKNEKELARRLAKNETDFYASLARADSEIELSKERAKMREDEFEVRNAKLRDENAMLREKIRSLESDLAAARDKK